MYEGVGACDGGARRIPVQRWGVQSAYQHALDVLAGDGKDSPADYGLFRVHPVVQVIECPVMWDVHRHLIDQVAGSQLHC